MPIGKPEMPSPLRLKAYKEGLDLIGPDGDSEGWFVVPSFRAQGTLFEKREVDLECSLAIAKPLTYSIGSPIPLQLTISGADSEALDLLSKPLTIRIHLVRSLAIGSDAVKDDAPRRSNNFFKESSARASFWPAPGGSPDGSRVLLGEIEVRKNLKPSFIFPRMACRV
jgi:hypothetical protein